MLGFPTNVSRHPGGDLWQPCIIDPSCAIQTEVKGIKFSPPKSQVVLKERLLPGSST